MVVGLILTIIGFEMNEIIGLIIALLAFRYVEEQREIRDSNLLGIVNGLATGAIIILTCKILLGLAILFLAVLKWVF